MKSLQFSVTTIVENIKLIESTMCVLSCLEWSTST